MPSKLTRSLLVLALLAPAARAADEAPQTDEQKTIYALGLSLARNLSSFGLSEAELKLLEQGLADGLLGRPARVPLETYAAKIQALASERMKVAAEAEKRASAEFLKKAAGEKGAVQTPSGLIYTETKPGKGDHPAATSTVKVHYQGTLRDGTVFDSSLQRGQPATFPLNGVIPCWTEGVQKMAVGGKARLVCPSKIAYGDRAVPPHIKPGSTLTFEIELLEIVKK